MRQGNKVPCVTQIPLTYGHNHQTVEPEVINLILRAIVCQFGGFTPLGTIKDGTWVDPDTGEEVEEDQMRIEVWVLPFQIPVFKELVHSIGRATKQKQMFIIIPNARVHQVDIRDADACGLLF